MIYKAVISDFDGTLFSEESAITESLKEKIVQLQEKGLIFSIATGRSLEDAVLKKHQIPGVNVIANYSRRRVCPRQIYSFLK